MSNETGGEREDIHAVLLRHWGFREFRPMQEQIIRQALEGRDTLALLPTGGGKSLCFQVPALAMGRMCLVVSPLIALMKDQVQRLRSMGISARALTSGMSHAEIDNTLESAALGKLSFLYVSPERLASELFLARVTRMPIGLLAVDEAHCISQWGYDFRPAYQRIREVRALLPRVPVLALTASATAEVATDIMHQLDFAQENVVRGSFHRPELVLWISKGEDRTGRLLRVMQHVPGSSIVYVRDRRQTVRLAQFLNHHGHSAQAYHAGLDHAIRDRIQQSWTSNELRCVVATNAFGMGIDKPDVRSVVHMELPPDLESYYQEAGRAGRDGRTSHAFLLTAPGDDERALEKVIASFPPLAHVRTVYQAFADQHGIALGSGSMESYPLAISTLAQRTALAPSVVANALKVLELDGRIALSDGVHSPSRVFITAHAKVVYDTRVRDVRNGPLLETLLRLHGGLFEEASIIDESRMARVMGTTSAKVIAGLERLNKLGIIAYRQRNDLPSLTLLQPRADAQRLQLDPASLKLRQERAQLRCDAMLRFVHGSECRSRMLLAYFGEGLEKDCGQCDNCRSTNIRNYGHGVPLSVPTGPAHVLEPDVEALRWKLDEEGAL
jgi:ATP-dependent DNA helicase RecQ